MHHVLRCASTVHSTAGSKGTDSSRDEHTRAVRACRCLVWCLSSDAALTPPPTPRPIHSTWALAHQPVGRLETHVDLPRTLTLRADAGEGGRERGRGGCIAWQDIVLHDRPVELSDEDEGPSGDGGPSSPQHQPRQAGAVVRHSTTHSFLLYLTDCDRGGETVLHSCRPGDDALAEHGGVAPGARAVLAKVAPRRGRLLLMPLNCPHSAAPVVDAPKVLIRGEVLVLPRSDQPAA